MDDQRFDNAVKALARQSTSRRTAVGGLIAALGPTAPALGGSQRGKSKGRSGSKTKPKAKGKKGKRSARPNPPDICDTTWPDADNREHCRFIREQCAGDDPREFCIRDGVKPDGAPTKVAVCCAEGETCCDASCCPKGHACCRGEHGDTCCREDQTCCGGFCCGTNKPSAACCDGQCVDTDYHRGHCGSCGNACSATEYCEVGKCFCAHDCDECPAGLTWCGDRCVDTKSNSEHCGGCYAFNPNGLKCCDGNLCTYINGVCCGGTCYPEGWPSCG